METASIVSLLTENGPGVVLACVFGYLYWQERKARISAEEILRAKLEADIVIFRDIALKAQNNV